MSSMQFTNFLQEKFGKIQLYLNLLLNDRSTFKEKIARKLNPSLAIIKTKSYLRRKRLNNIDSIDDFGTTDLKTLNLSTEKSRSKTVSKPVSIVIPTYNAAKLVKKCVESVLENLPEKAKIIIIDDNSDDNDLLTLLNQWSKQKKIVVIHTKGNQGFVKNVNLGFRLTNKTDVIILNSDTVVTKNWISKLQATAYKDETIATVTPLTNNGEIASVPTICQANSLVGGQTIESQSDLIYRFSTGQPIEVPTGVGYCMYIKRQALEEVGLFDEISYGMGYGEENDFCLRAQNLGWKNVIDDTTFVYHFGTSSFESETKKELINNHLSIVNSKYPNYENAVTTYISQNPTKHIQDLLTIAEKFPDFFTDPVVLYLIHRNPFSVIGGVELDALRVLRSINKKIKFLVIHRDDDTSTQTLFVKFVTGGKVIHQLTYTTSNPINTFDLYHPEITQFLDWILKVFSNIKVTHIEHSFGWPITSLSIFKNNGKKVIVNFHDFYYLSPMSKLIDPSMPRFVSEVSAVKKSYQVLENKKLINKKYKHLRFKLIQDFFKKDVDIFIFNSKYTLDVYKKHFKKTFYTSKTKIISPYV